MSKKLVVLVVDDDMINRKLLRSMLMKNSNVDEILESQNGAEALEQLRLRDDINLILLDVIMPLMNGLEMLEIIRSDRQMDNIPIIILTTDETKKRKALELGANGFILKPIRNTDLMQKIDSLILS
jgi:putative two-component system response regulator